MKYERNIQAEIRRQSIKRLYWLIRKSCVNGYAGGIPEKTIIAQYMINEGYREETSMNHLKALLDAGFIIKNKDKVVHSEVFIMSEI